MDYNLGLIFQESGVTEPEGGALNLALSPVLKLYDFIREHV